MASTLTAKGVGTQPRTQRAQRWGRRPLIYTLHRYGGHPLTMQGRYAALPFTPGECPLQGEDMLEPSLSVLLSVPLPCSIWVPTVKSRNEKIHKKN